jgi:3-oxoacyl-(acyl-carrier-protein) synthase
MRVAITGVGLQCALGADPSAVAALLAAGRSGVRPAGDARDSLPGGGIAACDVDVRPYLRRRKDRKLLPRAAWLAIPAAADAIGDDRVGDVGLFLGVGLEPPEDDTAGALVAAARDGRLDVTRLGREGLAAYPPLASLTTLPNLVLAHVAIQLGFTGEGATRAGDGAAGLAAIVEAVWSIEEGRCEVAIAGGADSLVHSALARDQVRRGFSAAPGEAAAVLRLEGLDAARSRGARILAAISRAESGLFDGPGTPIEHHAGLGRCGAADGAVAVVLGLAAAPTGRVSVRDESGARAALWWTSPPGPQP